MSLLQRARDSGKCPPSLLSEDRVVTEDGFDDAAMQILDATDFKLSSDPSVEEGFSYLLQTTSSLDSTPGSAEQKKEILQQRRAILLAILSGTPSSSPSLSRVVTNGFLASVKLWLDDILSSSVGGVDFLLHLLSSIAHLPVTKSTVKTSGMGKIIGTIEKHKICKGTPNEAAITSRVQEIKDAWNKSVKAHKAANGSAKRASEDASLSPSSAKRIKPDPGTTIKPGPEAVQVKPDPDAKIKSDPDAKKKTSSFSSLMKKVSGPKPEHSNSSSKKATTAKAKKSAMRVKWSDHFGGALMAAKIIDGDSTSEEAHHENSVNWADRKKRDRLREKELLAKAKKAKLFDDDEDDLDMSMPKQMEATSAWHVPSLLPPLPDVSPANLASAELTNQDERMKTVIAANYSSEYDVPASPAPLSDIEQALDMTSQSSAVVSTISFFAPQAAPAPAPTPVPAYAPPPAAPLYPPAQAQSTPATAELVQSLGLPMYMVGQDSQALTTLAQSPGLLATLVDATGAYDQARLMQLVQTLSATTPGSGTPQPPMYQPPTGAYGAPTPPAPTYGQPQSFQSGPPRTSSSEGNLHISGYGPSTSPAEITALFSPYVRVDGVVMKGTFSFVNTSDPVNAQRAREALNGTLLGGMPVRINSAQRKNRDSNPSFANTYGGGGASNGTSAYSAPTYGGASNGTGPYGQAAPPNPSAGVPAYGGAQQVPGIPPGVSPAPGGMVQNVDSVRDDRGNAATKNLFVAGYGQGTSEQQIRDMFSQHANVIGVVMKGSFTFVNTSDRAMAVQARNALGNTTVNGGVLRINFAKETGRLGTSFDLTYGRNTGPNAQRGAPPPGGSYYGRGGY